MARRLILIAAVLGFAASGCKQDTPGPDPNQKQTAQPRKEAAMGTQIQWLGHASFKITTENAVIYIDPWKLEDTTGNADYILVSHSHYDHYSVEDIAKIADPNTRLVASSDVTAKERRGEPLMPGMTIKFDEFTVRGVPAYNPDKQFHPRSNNWLGFVIEVDSKRIYYAGDTDFIDEMKQLEGIDVALMPVGGTYTMDASEAAAAVNTFKPRKAVPYHWGDIVGAETDAQRFKSAADCEVIILTPGQSMAIR